MALFLTLGLAGAWVGAVGTTRYVDDATCPSVGSGTQANPYCKIQDAICAAVSGDTVSVAPGTYAEAIRMRPGVSVISQGGAAVTTINAANQPCTDNAFCTKRPGNQCSVVTFGSGHTTSTVLDGFTIRGGAGLPQTAPDKVAGGGIYVFSSPTIINNVITSNALSGPAPNNQDMRGAGIYVSTGSAVISNNTISGNLNIPPPGDSTSSSFGYGGGVWLSAFADPVLTRNTITGNRAGDPNVAYSVGVGGGIASFTPGGARNPHIIDRNWIADNRADSNGGGISIQSDAGSTMPAAITNNVIVGNISKFGGGIYQYFAEANIFNNTITANEGFLGGGIYLGVGGVTFPVSVTSNIITSNTLAEFGNGGGIYKRDFSEPYEPLIQYNLLWGNEGSQVGGDITDGGTIGTNNNFTGNPRFINTAARDFHLDPNSPAIDRALAAGAPTVDYDGLPRGIDADGVPNSPRTGDVDVGAFERQFPCAGGPEVCDGLDNNCDLLVDEGFPNTDGDTMANCVDPDDDNDGELDGGDCAPLDSTAFGTPFEVAGLAVAGASPTSVSFTTQAIGSGTTYEVVAGSLTHLSMTNAFQGNFCLTSSTMGSPWTDTHLPPRPGEGWYYLVGSQNACGEGTFGSTLRDQTGAGDACELGHVDADGDGSPSHLDCNDSNPNRSHLLVEVCDNVDNDCDNVVDDGNPGGGATCGTDVGECSFGTMVCTGGSLQCTGGVGPATEICDSLDNDCNGATDEVTTDFDNDGQTDCVDTDDDNDLAPDTSDCAPMNPTAFGVPTEVQDFRVLGGFPSQQLLWQQQSIGSGTTYTIGSGLITTPASITFTSGACLLSTSGPPAVAGGSQPAPGAVRYYLVKSRNACGTGTYGSAARDQIPACP